MTECKTCHGYGLWNVGMHLPMEKEHFNEGMPNEACPECGAGKREIKEHNISELTIDLKEELYSETRYRDIPMENKIEALCDVIKKVVEIGEA